MNMLHQPIGRSVLAWIALIVAVLLSSAVLDLGEVADIPDDLEKQKYFVLEPATQEVKGKVVLATYKQISLIQCRHRCNRNIECMDVVIERENLCMLLGQGEGNELTLTATMETVFKIKMLVPGKRLPKFLFTFYE